MIHTQPQQVASENRLYVHPLYRGPAEYVPHWHLKKGIVERGRE